MLAAARGAEPSCVSRREQKLDSVRWALTHGGQNPGTRDDDGFTAIHIAAASNKNKVLQLMLDMCRRSRELELIDLRDGEARPAARARAWCTRTAATAAPLLRPGAEARARRARR